MSSSDRLARISEQATRRREELKALDAGQPYTDRETGEVFDTPPPPRVVPQAPTKSRVKAAKGKRVSGTQLMAARLRRVAWITKHSELPGRVKDVAHHMNMSGSASVYARPIALLGRELGISRKHAHDYVQRLVQAGFLLRKAPGKKKRKVVIYVFKVR